MGHAKLDNRTPLAVSTTHATDEEGRPLLVVLAQATYAIVRDRPLIFADHQEPASLTGELWGADAATSGYRVEPAFAFTKLATDVVLVGHAVARRAVPEMLVTFRVGPVGKTVRVVGDRHFVRAAGGVTPTRPAPFESVPLSYDRAFGGWDRSSTDPAAPAFEPENPVGRGYVAPNAPFREGLSLPNLEDPAAPLERWGQRVPPAGVGFVSPEWQPRAALGGSYDDAWSRERMPRLPRDFDRRFFNAASRGLVANGYLRGDEEVVVDGASPAGRLAFRLPGAPTPSARIALAAGSDATLELRLDTLIVDTDADRVLLLYRGFTPLRDGPHDVRSIEVKAGGAGASGAGRSAWP